MSALPSWVPADPVAGEIRPIRTTRLDLVVMPLGFMVAILWGEEEAAMAMLGLSSAPDWPPTALGAFQLSMEDADGPAHHRAWLPRAVIVRRSRVLVGHAGFPWPPEPDGTARLDFDVFDPRGGTGYGAEVIRALSAWALERGARTIRAEAREVDIGRVDDLVSAGFRLVGSRAGGRRRKLCYELIGRPRRGHGAPGAGPSAFLDGENPEGSVGLSTVGFRQAPGSVPRRREARWAAW